MTHNCQTILQPCLTPAEYCTLPTRGAHGEGYVSLAQERCALALELIRSSPGITQHRVATQLGLSGATASRTVRQLVDLGQIELVTQHPNSKSPRKVYRVKEVLQ